VRRVLISPKWLGLHVLATAAALTCLALGWWQWRRAHEAGGGAQNLGYALQWPLFAAFVGYFWSRLVRDAVRSDTAGAARRLTTAPPVRVAPPMRRAGSASPSSTADDDPELAAYNRYLAELTARDTAGHTTEKPEREPLR
jgi:DNA-binding transcriptional regulator of glucitol operon